MKKCDWCKKRIAKWIHEEAGKENPCLCGDCVPKGCSCNSAENDNEPCCEWRFSETGFPE